MSVLPLPTLICGMGSARLFTYSYMRSRPMPASLAARSTLT